MAISPCFDQFFSDLAEHTFALHTSALKSATCPFLSALHPPTYTHTHISQIHALYCQSPGGLCSGGFSLSPSVVFAARALCPIGTYCVGRRCMCQILSALERFCLQGLDQGTATSDLHLYGMEDKERKRGKLVPALRE